MSRKANKPIQILEGANVAVSGGMLTVKGPKGELSIKIHPFVTIEVTDSEVIVSVKNPENKPERAMWGTFGAHVVNMMMGVTQGFSKQLEINGVGYGFDLSGKLLKVKAGYSHLVEIPIPADVEATQERNVLTLTSHDKQKLGQLAAEIRKVRKPEPYKGKGIQYVGEYIIRKQGKQSASS